MKCLMLVRASARRLSLGSKARAKKLALAWGYILQSCLCLTELTQMRAKKVDIYILEIFRLWDLQVLMSL